MKAGIFEIGGQPAVKCADDHADGDHEHDGDRPDGGMANAENGHQLENLQDGAGDGDKAEHRADGQVELAHDDQQHHARGHDGDRGRLHQQRPQIARREERTAQQAAEIAAHDAAGNVEGRPDQQQGGHHAKQALVDLGGAEEPLYRPFVFKGGSLIGVWQVGHVASPCGRCDWQRALENGKQSRNERRRPDRHRGKAQT